MTRQATSSSANVVERMRLEERDVDGQKAKFIVNELVLTDPKIYTTPIKITGTLRHRPDLQLLEYTCTDALWDEYLSERGLTLPDLDALPDPQPCNESLRRLLFAALAAAALPAAAHHSFAIYDMIRTSISTASSRP